MGTALSLGFDQVQDPSSDPDYWYDSSEGRDEDLGGDARDPAYRDDCDRYSSSVAEGSYKRNNEPCPYRGHMNGRHKSEDDCGRPEECRREELYRQYYEELQRRYDTDRPADCSVIVVNKAEKEYAETVRKKVRDLGMVVDLIFLKTEVSLTQALEDVCRARTPFAIIITQQHQVLGSCTVNILFGTPQEHRNMPMQDAMMLVAHNYDTYKVENREKEREEIARKAAKMADDVLLREPDRESHPISVLTTITLLSENRFVTPDELDGLIAHLKEKRAHLLQSAAEPHVAGVHTPATAATHAEIPPTAAGLPPPSHTPHLPPQSNHLSLTANSSAPANPNHQQELQAKILSLFNSGTGGSTGPGGQTVPQTQAYSSLGPAPSQNVPRQAMPGLPPSGSQGFAPPPGRMPVAPGGQRPPPATSGINFDNPSVQKALDTLIQSGPTLNPLVSAAASQQQQQQQQPPRPSSSAPANPNHQQELQAKILSLFNSGTGGSTGPGGQTVPQSQSSIFRGPPPSQAMPGPPPFGSQHFAPTPGYMPHAPGGQRPFSFTSGINFDDPRVQKALDTLIQRGPALN